MGNVRSRSLEVAQLLLRLALLGIDARKARLQCRLLHRNKLAHSRDALPAWYVHCANG